MCIRDSRGIGVVSTKYGKIDDMVLQMEVVLPNGDIIETSPAPKHAAGPDLNQIFIGSEGTLGVMTKAQILSLIHISVTVFAICPPAVT